MHFEYLPDRTPVIPLGLVVGDRILAVHTVKGEAGAEVEQVGSDVVSVRAQLVEPGHFKVTIGYLADGEMAHREFDDPGQWLSVRPRRLTLPTPLFTPADAEDCEVAA